MPATTTELAKQYRPADVEGEILARWDDANAFHADESAGGNPFAVVIPPPNVTAALHMGHALNNTLQDILVRWHRMMGDNTMWMPGTDHAGIATQTVVDKRLQVEGQPALKDYKRIEAEGGNGREQFIDKVQQWKDEYEARITDQLVKMGCSCDWDRQRFTMDDVCAKAVREAFFQLFKDGLIYRGKRLVNWDPVTQTALADDEVEMETVDGHFWYMKYPVVEERDQGTEGSSDQGSEQSLDGSMARSLGRFVDTGEFVTVATTRPETMLGDTAVAVNPDDPERAKFIGRNVRLPIVNRIIPVVGDDYVVKPDPESKDEKARFASGFLKVTPAHDPNDWEIGQRHDLSVINVMAPDASISKDHGWSDWDDTPRDEFCEILLGMDRYEAREAIVTWFREQGLLDDVRPYSHSVGHSYRSHVPVEPYLSDQWYVKVTDERLAGAALRAMVADQRSDSDGPIWRDGEEERHGGTEARRHEESDGDGAGAGDVNARRQPSAGFEGEGDPGALRFYPARYAKTFQSWHENIRDWCISRQLWWGHRIPVWTAKINTRSRWLDVSKMGLNRPTPFGIVVAQLTKLFDWSDDADEAITWDQSIPTGTSRKDRQAGVDESCPTVIRICSRDPRVDELLTEFAKQLQDSERGIPIHSKFQQLAECVTCIERDPDVLDTWFSSALWPISTLGWPDEENNAALQTWNPSNVLCTAREIITLWVSRMVMFNTYFRGCLPFTDVFIHAMIQDGEGQKMSKSLGNGVDPLDIIHSHGSDAMRFTLAEMTTHTQDVRMPVDVVCPHTGEAFHPKMITNKAGFRVAAPVQKCPTDGNKKFVTGYGVASGEAKATDEMPQARNTSSRFDYGRNFANKLWNATRFALSHLEERHEGTEARRDEGSGVGGSLVDRWILTRTADVIAQTDDALAKYDFHRYAHTLYQFIWNDVCDWYIEAIKPTVKGDAGQRRVLATVLDVCLRLLHPSMPFITEKLWEHLQASAPERGVDGLPCEPSELLSHAAWPRADVALRDEAAEDQFERARTVVTMIREVRAENKVPPREKVEVSIKLDAELADMLRKSEAAFTTLANITIVAMGPDVAKPEHAAVVVRPLAEVYLHQQFDAEAERDRLTKRLAEVEKNVKALSGRLNNKGYTEKAPEKLVQETRDKLAEAESEAAKLRDRLGGL